MGKEVRCNSLGKSAILLSNLPSDWGGDVGDQILIRDGPPRVRTWIESEGRARKMGQKEFVIEALEKASEGGQPTLFDDTARRLQPMPESDAFKFMDLFAGITGN